MSAIYIRKKLLVVIAVLLQQISYTQSYYFRHYQVENGLSNNATICCLQDQKGFLWFGTKDGLNRFDGYSFKIFRHDPQTSGSIGSNFIHCLFEDKNGTLWIGTESGLYQYNATNERFTLLKNTVNQSIRDVTMDGRGVLWYISGFTIYQYNKAKSFLRYYNTSTHFEATSLCTSPNGVLWASTISGLLEKYDTTSESFVSYNIFQQGSQPGISNWIERIVSTRNGDILVGTSNHGAKIFNPETRVIKNILTNNPDKTAVFVRNFLQTAENEYWIASESGIFIYNSQTGNISNLQKAYNDPYSISDNAVYTFCRDKEGGIWAGTYFFGGVNYYPKPHTAFKKYFPKIGENSLSGNVIREIHADKNGNLWIGTEDAGLNRLDTLTGKFTSYLPSGEKTSISYTNIHGLLVNDDELWIGTFEHGLDVMNINTGKVIKHYSAGPNANAFKSNFIFCITKTVERDILIGTTAGAYRYNKLTDGFDPIKELGYNGWYSYLLKDREGITWAATYGDGVHFFDNRTNRSGNIRYHANGEKTIGSDRVNSIFEDANNYLWFATEGGLSKYDKKSGTLKNYTTKNGFPSDFILSILEDSKKNLWVSTSKGIVCFNPQTEQVKTYTRINGILNDQFNFNSAYKDASGRMYFGSVKGMISFHPNEFTDNTFIPPVYITGFQVFNSELSIASTEAGTTGLALQKAITFTDKVKLKYDQSNISIDFAALSFTAPEMSEYAYKLEGVDKNWTYLKRNRKAYFTELAPATYQFKVKAANSSGLWNEKETQLTIEILPPWWASNLAYFLYALLLIVLIYYGIRIYHQTIEAKNKRKYELLERAKEKEVFAAKIDFFTNVAHEIKTPLTLIKAPLEKVLKKAGAIPEINSNLLIMERNTNRLIDLTNQLLDFRQTEIKGFSLSFVQANIGELLNETFINFKPLAEQKNLSFSLKLPRAAIYAFIDLDAFNKILYNLFSNAVKYAEKKVTVQLEKTDDSGNTFTIEIKNDGFIIPEDMREKIFEPFFRMKETVKQRGTGIGLALSLSLVQLHKGTLNVKTGANNMNVFVLQLPVHQDIEFTLNHISPTDQ